MQKVRGHLHSDSTPSWPTDHVARKGREAPPVCTGASCAQGYQRRACAMQRLAELPWPEAG